MAFYFSKDGELMAEYCRKNGLCYCVVRRQMVRGVSFEDAIKHAKEHKGKRGLNNARYFYNGKSLRSIYPKNIYKRMCEYIRRNKCTIKEAIKWEESK